MRIICRRRRCYKRSSLKRLRINSAVNRLVKTAYANLRLWKIWLPWIPPLLRRTTLLETTLRIKAWPICRTLGRSSDWLTQRKRRRIVKWIVHVKRSPPMAGQRLNSSSSASISLRGTKIRSPDRVTSRAHLSRRRKLAEARKASSAATRCLATLELPSTPQLKSNRMRYLTRMPHSWASRTKRDQNRLIQAHDRPLTCVKEWKRLISSTVTMQRFNSRKAQVAILCPASTSPKRIKIHPTLEIVSINRAIRLLLKLKPREVQKHNSKRS